MKTLSAVAVYFGIASVAFTVITFALKRSMEKVLIRAVALRSVILLLEGRPLDWEELRKIYEQVTRGDLKNYEAVEIVDEMQRVLERDGKMEVERGAGVFKKIKSTIPTNKQFDQEYGCLLILSIPLLLGFIGMRSGASDWSRVAINSALILVPSLLFLIGNINAWSSLFSTLRRKAEYQKEYLLLTGEGDRDS